MTRNRLITLILLLAVAVLAGFGIWRYSDRFNTSNGPAGEAGATQVTGTAMIGGPFALTNQDGKRVTDQDFRGKYMLIYFGFTFCPDVCPTELQAMTTALKTLGAQGAMVQPIFISVDPDRDTPQVLATYVKQFDPRLVGLTGSHEDIATAAKAYRVYYGKVKDENSVDYSVDHSSIVYLMGPDGKFLTFFGPGVSPDDMAKKISSYF